MLRTLVLALMLANGTYLAWTQGFLEVYGFAPASQAEPQRLAQQIRPEAIELLKAIPAPAPTAPPDTGPPPPADDAPKPGASAPEPGASAALAPAVALAAARASASTAAAVMAASAPVAVPALVRIATAPAPAAPQCLQAGLFTEQQASALRARLQARLPAGSWSFVGTREPARWIVYMGRYVGKDELQNKRLLLKQAGVAFTTPLSPQLNPGLSLGSFKTRAQAEAALARLSTRGVRSARVVQELAEPPTLWLRLPAADAALQARAKALIPQLSGKRLQACS